MKNILQCTILLFTAITLHSCQTTFSFQPEKVAYLDYSKYLTNNFYITESSQVDFKYIPLGSVIVNNYSATDLDATFENFVNKCKEKGANGIINLQFSFSPDKSGYISGYIIKGMAVKREGTTNYK